jgi:hypothetical protein
MPHLRRVLPARFTYPSEWYIMLPAHKRSVRGICLLPFRQLRLEDKELLARYTKGIEYENSELSFANLFIWRQGWGIEICEHEGVLYFSYVHPDNGCTGQMQPVVPAGMPLRPAVETAMRDLAERECGLDIMGVNDEFLARFRAEGTQGYAVEEDRDLMEYVYRTEDLINLSGKKYHSKRNHLNKFLAEYAYTWQDLTPDFLTQCLSICAQWMSEREGGSVDRNELCAIREAITHMNELGLIGALVCVDGRPRAFTVGERFKPDMAIIHLEKADPDVPGIYAFINREFLSRNFSDMEFVNREEDMGLPGLRQAKLSYNPARLVNKYRIRKA